MDWGGVSCGWKHSEGSFLTRAGTAQAPARDSPAAVYG